MYMIGSGAGEGRFRFAPRAEKDVQQPRVEHNRDCHRAVRQASVRQFQVNQDSGQTETDDPDVEAHAHAAKRFGVESPDEVGAQRNAYEDARNDRGDDSEAVNRKQTKVVIGNGSQGRFGNPNQSEASSKLLLDQPLIIEQHRQGRAGYRRDGIQEAEPRSERNTDQLFRPDRPAHTRRLKKNKRKEKGVSGEFQPARMNQGEKVTACRNPGQQSDEYRINPLPYCRNARPVDEEDIQVDENLDENQRRVQNAVGIEKQPHRYGERGKSITDRAVDERREESHGDKNDRGGFDREHGLCGCLRDRNGILASALNTSKDFRVRI